MYIYIYAYETPLAESCDARKQANVFYVFRGLENRKHDPLRRGICESGEETVGMTFWPRECHKHTCQCYCSWQQTITLTLHLQLFWPYVQNFWTPKSSVEAYKAACTMPAQRVHQLLDSLGYFCTVKNSKNRKWKQKVVLAIQSSNIRATFFCCCLDFKH